jgi:hypothetical protein
MYVSALKPGDRFTLTGFFTASPADTPQADGIRLYDQHGEYVISAVLDDVISVGGGWPLPSMRLATTDEATYQMDAARSMQSAAKDLRKAADRIGHLASLLAEGNVSVEAFPNVGVVRDAIREYMSATHALMRLDSAIESAMLADQTRGKGTPTA